MIGGDLNGPLDNLWFTLLFKRRSALLETEARFDQLCNLFWDRMTGQAGKGAEVQAVLTRLSQQDRFQHSKAWLQARAESWLSMPATPGVPWAWKEPNTHLVLERLFVRQPELRYIHFLRNPLDMAISANQQQLWNWGPVILNRPVEIGPRDSLSYICAVTERIFALSKAYAGRICMVDFELLCRQPETVCRQIGEFIGTTPDRETVAWFADMVTSGAPEGGRGKAIDRSVFFPDDLAFIEALGYDVG